MQVQFIKGRYNVIPVYPVVHPFPCGRFAEILLDVLPKVVIACLLEPCTGSAASSIESYSPTSPQRVDLGARNSSTTFVDNTDTGFVSVCVALQRPAYYRLTVFAKYIHETSFHRSGTILLNSERLDDRADAQPFEFPMATHQFQEMEGQLVEPRRGILKEGRRTTFCVRLVSSVRECVLTGSSGTITLTCTPEIPDRQSDYLSSPSRARNFARQAHHVFETHVVRPKEGSMMMWADGLALLQWTVESTSE
jgi:hypothetical protein